MPFLDVHLHVAHIQVMTAISAQRWFRAANLRHLTKVLDTCRYTTLKQFVPQECASLTRIIMLLNLLLNETHKSNGIH